MSTVDDLSHRAPALEPVRPHPTPGRAALPDISKWVAAHAVAAACLATLVLHLLFLTRDLWPDEGGFAMVARYWTTGGPFLYGPQWVDRPPGLILLFRGADLLGPYGVRLTAAAVAIVLVAATAWAAGALGGPASASWAAWSAFAFAASPLLGAQELNGELAAAALVSLSIGATLRAVGGTRPSRSLWFGVLGGVSASGAVLVKQNFVDAAAFAVVLLVVGSATGRNRRRFPPDRLLRVAAAWTLGASLPVGATLAWAVATHQASALLYAVYGFRADATAVMAAWSWHAPMQRLVTLLEMGVVSGLLVLAAHLVVTHRHRLRAPEPLVWALVAAGGVEVAGVVAGQNFWPHYLLGLVPTVSLAAARCAGRRGEGWRATRALVAAAAVLTVVVGPGAAAAEAGTPDSADTVGRWLGASAARGDSVVVPFSHANVIEAAGLRPAYPYSWSLPVRTLDPDLTRLVTALDRPGGPTWVVRWDWPHSWGLDPADRVAAALATHYREVADVCGHPVWLRRDADRPLAPLPTACA